MVNEIQEQIKSNSKRKETNVATTASSKKRSFQEILPQSKMIQYIVPNFDDLESHPPGTITTPTAIIQSPRTDDTESVPKKKGSKATNFIIYQIFWIRHIQPMRKKRRQENQSIIMLRRMNKLMVPLRKESAKLINLT